MSTIAMRIEQFTTEELRRELERRNACACGSKRIEVVIEENEKFFKRTGCATCNNWDGPPRLKYSFNSRIG